MTERNRRYVKIFEELSNRAFMRDIPIFSHFLTVAEQTILWQSRSQLAVEWKLFGGTAYAERQMVGFFPDAFSAVMDTHPFPLVYLLVSPRSPRFGEELGHRDILGACMNLGVKREMLGDIYTKGQQAVMIADARIEDFLTRELERIKHTAVNVKRIDTFPNDFITPPQLDAVSVSSLRLDVFLAELFGLSRKIAAELVDEGRAMINSLPMYSKNYQMKAGDILSARGYGRVRFIETFGESKKGRIWIHFERYQ
ncbi:MAG: YlmH/Sll1252 family protein [Eubacteriales bacterium]|nr:YlmH/Sll1252 family protein [Eubacteriales bacterium]